MEYTEALRLTTQALWMVLILSAPPIIAASIVGIIVALFQAATQLQEQTMQYTLKFFAIVLAIFATSGALGGTLYVFADEIFTEFPALVRR